MRFWPFKRLGQQSNQEDILLGAKSEKVYSIIELPKPNITGGLSLADALSKRRSLRNFFFERISDQELSNILWSACGISLEIKSGNEVKYFHTNPTA